MDDSAGDRHVTLDELAFAVRSGDGQAKDELFDRLFHLLWYHHRQDGYSVYEVMEMAELLVGLVVSPGRLEAFLAEEQFSEMSADERASTEPLRSANDPTTERYTPREDAMWIDEYADRLDAKKRNILRDSFELGHKLLPIPATNDQSKTLRQRFRSGLGWLRSLISRRR